MLLNIRIFVVKILSMTTFPHDPCVLRFEYIVRMGGSCSKVLYNRKMLRMIYQLET